MGQHLLPGNPPVELTLRRSARARRISLRVSGLDGRVTLSLPNGVSSAEALAFAKAAKSNLTTRAVTINLANLYIKMADYDRAMEFAQSALKISRSTNNILEESTAEKIIARIYDLKNQYKESIEHYKRYDELSKQIREKNI